VSRLNFSQVSHHETVAVDFTEIGFGGTTKSDDFGFHSKFIYDEYIVQLTEPI